MSYREKRVRVSVYGSLPGSSPLLVPVPTSPGRAPQRLHVLAARSLADMSQSCSTDLGIALAVASGWRPHRWPSRESYEALLAEKYGSVARGRKFLAYDSPHETGLAVDLGCGGLAPVSTTIARQRKTPLHAWLKANAWRFGFHPYKAEPWHWEHPVELGAYLSGA